jgi:large subunit ribosomal protein L25
MKIQLRKEKGSKVRSTTVIPGVLYGKGMEAVTVKADMTQFLKMFYEMGTSKTFDITLEGKKHVVYFKEVQSLYSNHTIKTHFDMVKVAKGDIMSSSVKLDFLNRNELEKKGLIVNTVLDSIDIEYPVGSGVSHLELDVSELKEFDTLHVSDIVAPKGVTIITSMDSVVVSISTPKEEVEVDPDAEVPEVEIIKQNDKE